MKRIILLTALLFAVFATSASADWRWSAPNLKPHKATYKCSDYKCLKKTYKHERHILTHRIDRYNKHKLQQWRHWTSLYIPTCTWYGESGPGPQFARFRYSVPNSAGSGAYGKYQMMPGTYRTFARYFDWSPLDQEIAGHKLYFSQSTSPWQAC